MPLTHKRLVQSAILGCVVVATACGDYKSTDAASASATHTVTASAAPTTAANATGQTQAFAGQTRAPAPANLSRVKVQTITDHLVQPWGVEALRDGRFVVTEKSGSLRVVTSAGRVLPAIAGVPKVDTAGQGGLLDVAIDEQHQPLTLCVTYAEPRPDSKNGTAAACAAASGSENLTLEPMKVVFRQEPAWQSSLHFGSRLVFAGPDHMYITTGERSLPESRVFAQDTNKTLGKVIRLRRDGTAPGDNPFAGQGEQ
ncbi:MAG: hypothetical protein RL701_7288, partial [Pseudomonadota bacterium]